MHKAEAGTSDGYMVALQADLHIVAELQKQRESNNREKRLLGRELNTKVKHLKLHTVNVKEKRPQR